MSSPHEWRTAWPARTLLLALVVAIVFAVPLSMPGAQAVPTLIPGPVPAPRELPIELDQAQQYQGQSICDPIAKPGIKMLRRLLRKTYGPSTFYTTRPCAADPTSEHTEGRALDWMQSLRVPSQKAKVAAFMDWLLAPGTDGTPAVMARRLGVMYVGWNSRIWRAYSPLGWGELKGCLHKPKRGRAMDTYCHRDHVHFSLTWDGAAAQTSYWDGTAVTSPPCPSPGIPAGRILKVPAMLKSIALNRNLLNTSSGFGNRRRVCRLQEDRWSGDGHRLNLKVAGRRGVPVDAVRVELEITAVLPNAPMNIFVWPTGRAMPAQPAMTTLINQTLSQIVTVRVGRAGSVTIATATGDTDLRASIISYQVADDLVPPIAVIAPPH